MVPPTTQSGTPDGGVEDAGSVDAGSPDSGVHTVAFEVEAWTPGMYQLSGYPNVQTRTRDDNGASYTVMMYSGGDVHSTAYVNTSELIAGQAYMVCANYLSFWDSPEINLEFGGSGQDYGTFPAGQNQPSGDDPAERCIGPVTIPAYSGTLQVHLRVGMTHNIAGQGGRWIGIDWVEFRPVTP